VALPTLPQQLAVVGGGAIGMEFAQMFHRFGVEITVLERGPNLLDKEDRELADLLCNLLTREGIRMETDAELRQVQSTPEGKCLKFHCGQGGEEEVEVDEILLAIGRRPTLEKLNLAATGVKTGKKGISVDETLRTSTPHIWAAGDVTGGYKFTHVAYEQGKLAAQNAFSAHPQPFTDRVIPWVTYTDPPLAHVGKTEDELRKEGIEYKVSRMKFSEVERAVANGKTDGLVKLLVDTRGQILGGHILGAGADDLLAPLIVAMQAHLPVNMLATSIIPYPTLSEAVRWAADRV
ncbi:MAG: FAD-dependent oxidoreductase, partial [Chloroflexi bacterium]|nr:FAD-dependent oxidoreductase [Chloroflexota bacterium]